MICGEKKTTNYLCGITGTMGFKAAYRKLICVGQNKKAFLDLGGAMRANTVAYKTPLQCLNHMQNYVDFMLMLVTG